VTDEQPRPRLVVLSEQDCWSLLEEAQVGRIAMNDADGPMILPVNYALDGTDVVFRTEEGGLLGTAADWGRPVAFEVDHIDEERRQGWGVVLRGELRRAGGEDAARLAPMVMPFPGGDRPVVGRIVASSISGRRVGED
jgi:nitroimidazol reductase NimA-like FMN-containing flavoprotein (pyridoxamine 5'-phosphate oxidase superfamily)